MRILQIQAHVYKEKEKNLDALEAKINEYKDQKIDLVTIGEMFDCPYQTDCFPKYAEKEKEATWSRLSSIASKFGVYLSAGSVPEKDDKGHIYNTAYVFDRQGRQIAKHRKVHFFDVDIDGGQHFHESDTLTAGNECTTFDTEFGKMGLCICFDCRFPEFVRLMALEGAKVILVPASFNMTTGPAHWELMLRSRGMDNQCFVVATSDARDEKASYVSWGHSMVVSPWGSIVSEMDEKVCAKVIDIDLREVESIRRQLPLISARREDVYELKKRKTEVV